MEKFDRLFYWFNKIRFYRKNKKFIKKHAGVSLPHDYMLYESYRLDYSDYFYDGRNTAQWLKNLLPPYLPAEGKILEWGCGPARVVRHLPEVFPGFEIHASDYNAATITWCRQNIKNVKFNLNGLHPPLPYAGNNFDVVYALSVFTHLSEINHHFWIKELHRVVKPEGLLLITTHGESFFVKLTSKERQVFTTGQLVQRDKVTEGHRSYTAFQPPAFMQTLYGKNWEIIKWIPGGKGEQDTWILKKY